jgi:3-hydroxybutyryl-CoA dehydrogenase
MTALEGAVCVVGAGTMGGGIATVAALAGHPVLLVDAEPDRAELAVERIADELDRSVVRGRLGPADARATVARVRALPSLDALADAEPCVLAVEAVVEDLEIKRALFARLQAVLPDGCVLGTNTSSLSVTAIGGRLNRPEQLVGMHFFNPVPRMRLVEIVTGLATAPEVVAAATETARAWGKTPVQARSTPGFVVNRVARPFYSEALRLLDEQAATPAVLDAVLREAGGFRMGPFELTDLIGQDVNAAVTRSVWQATGNDPRYAPSVAQTELVEAGWWGRKTGRGFYDHSPDAEPPAPPETVPPTDPPTSVTVCGDVGALAPLLARTELAVRHVDGPGFVELSSGAALRLTDGLPATVTAARLGRPVVLLDRCLDPQGVRLLTATASDHAPAVAQTETAGLLAAADVRITVIDDAPGLVVARTVAMLVNEAFDLLHRGGATEDDIDLAMRLGTNYPVGPFEWARRWGHDVVVTVLDNLAAIFGDGRHRVGLLLRRRACAVDAWHPFLTGTAAAVHGAPGAVPQSPRWA